MNRGRAPRRSRARAGIRGAALALSLVAAGCMTGAPAPPPGGETGTAAAPTGTTGAPGAADDFAGTGGSLRQEEITIRFDLPELEFRLTPLDPEILVLVAPDTRRRLTALAPRDGTSAFLVSAFTTTPGGVEFEPREIVLENRGRQYRPLSIRGLTPGWGTRLTQDQPEQAVYRFSGDVDLELPFTVELRGRRNDQWRAILTRLDAERARMRARGGDAPRHPQTSRPNFRILR